MAAGSEKEARALFQRAEMSFNLGKFAEALADYQAAYQVKPLPGFLFNIAQCYRNMGNYDRARFFFRRYLALSPRTSNRGLVEDLIEEMSRLLDKQIPGAAAPPPALLEPAVAAPGVATPALEVATAPVVPPPAPASAGEPAATLVSAPAPTPARRPIYKRWWFWTAAGTAVAGGVVAAFLLTRNTQPTGTLAPIDGR